MAEPSDRPNSAAPAKAQHLCVFVHGLWGNPIHLKYVAESLQKQHGDDIFILNASRNSGSFTYDGIEVGAERVTKEIEDTLEELKQNGYNITKFSIVGYSLGGLVARYVIGLLYHKGYFDRIKPVNFTTFATPHLGVRTPLTRYSNYIWNGLGARTLSTSGRQLFTVDTFRDTGRPILSVMADPDSIFIHALSRFENRSLYCNIINDRTAVFYTTGIFRHDPFTDLDKLKLNYVKGYEPVILDETHPIDVLTSSELPSAYQKATSRGKRFLQSIPLYLALALLIPIGIGIFLVNSTIQTFRSRRRITLHEKDNEGKGFSVYRIPYMVQNIRAGLEDAFGNVHSSQQPDYLPQGSSEIIETPPDSSSTDDLLSAPAPVSADMEKVSKRLTRRNSIRFPEFPTLALTRDQFTMINNLNDVGFHKHLVHIHKSNHSHAAIIVRTSRASFEDGKTVIKHWVEKDFRL